VKSKQSSELEKRFMDFGISIVKFSATLSELPPSIIDQIIRSSTSIGANYAEAQDAVSRADFKHKIAISKKEASETRYWLRVIEQLSNADLVTPYLQESQEIILILQKIINTLRSRPAT